MVQDETGFQHPDDTPIHLDITIHQYGIISMALGKLLFEQASPVMQNISAQANRQIVAARNKATMHHAKEESLNKAAPMRVEKTNIKGRKSA